jgi:hypothetical protein
MGRKFKKMKLKNNKTMFNILVMKKFACGWHKNAFPTSQWTPRMSITGPNILLSYAGTISPFISRMIQDTYKLCGQTVSLLHQTVHIVTTALWSVEERTHRSSKVLLWLNPSAASGDIVELLSALGSSPLSSTLLKYLWRCTCESQTKAGRIKEKVIDKIFGET